MYLKVVWHVGALRENWLAAAVKGRAVGLAVDDDDYLLAAAGRASDGSIAPRIVGAERLSSVQHALLSPLVEQVAGLAAQRRVALLEVLLAAVALDGLGERVGGG